MKKSLKALGFVALVALVAAISIAANTATESLSINSTTRKVLNKAANGAPAVVDFTNGTLKQGGYTVEQFAFRDLASFVSTVTDSGIAGLTAGTSAQNIYSSGTTRSLTHFLHDVDITCISLQTTGNWQAIAISPRQFVTANHVGPSNGTTVNFVTADGTTISRTLSNSSRIGSTDIQIGLLSADLPATIKPAKVLSAAQESLLIAGTPIFYADQNQKLYIGERNRSGGETTGEVLVNVPTTSPRSTFFKSGGPISGDSGSAIGTVIDGDWIAISEMHNGTTTSGSGNSLAQNYAAINSAMTSLGGSYQLTPIAAKMFSDFKTTTSTGFAMKRADGTFIADGAGSAVQANYIFDLEDGVTQVMHYSSADEQWYVTHPDWFRSALGATAVGVSIFTATDATTAAATLGLGWIADDGSNITDKAASYGVVGDDGTLKLFYDTDTPGWSVTDPGSFRTALSVGHKVSPPANAGSTGTTGDWAQDTGFIYICTATNTWKRVAIATW